MEQRVNIKFCFKLGKTAPETHEMLVKVYCVDAVSKKYVFEWFRRLRDGKEDVKDEPRSGRPPISTTPDNIERVRRMLADDRRLSLRMVAEEMKIGLDSVSNNIHEHLQKQCLLPGEEFQECGSTCPDTCENRGRPPPGSCPYRCNRGCFCRKGLYRTKSGQCVPLKDCGRQRHFTTKSKPITKRENTDAHAVTVSDDCHGCPNRAECEAYCKSFGDFIGLCTGKDRLHCRCA
ncbi:Putative uncharacterized protein FLJ37770 [Araneus ventricosus]|uniref:TIL domain-containing protein n=1 Tax=Araneus ventricosus TaxID=182803 RepID=A0A4Y2T3T4_ARAVE|nr:Putative uncharacterized protein FLJ37770 [Araneus ventricosus]